MRKPGVLEAEASVVKIVGIACGIGVEGSGWFARRDLVVTAAHVVAGERHTTVSVPNGGTFDADRRRVRPAQRRRRAARARRERDAAALSGSDAGNACRDPRLPEQRPVDGHAGPHRHDLGRPHPRRVRARSRRSRDHRRRRARAARQLGRSRGRRPRRRAHDDLRGAHRLADRLRRPDRDRCDAR